MKFKDKDGNVLVDIQVARAFYCRGKECKNCPVSTYNNTYSEPCDNFAGKYPLEAARLMGYEIIGEVKNPCIRCETGWGCSDGRSCTDDCERFAEYSAYLKNLEPGVAGQDDQEDTQKAKSDAGKPRPTLVPVSLIEAVTAIREYGCQKYHDPENWRKVEPQRYRDALYRHWLAYLKGEKMDSESGLPHLWHLVCNAAFLIEMEQ